MLFYSFEFMFLFLPAVVALHFLAARRSIEAAVIATSASSLFFYAWWNPKFVALPVLSVAINLLLARVMLQARRYDAAMLAAGIAANLAVLCYFKYSDFLLSVWRGTTPGQSSVPLALSFTTFVQIAFLCDLYKDRQQVNGPRYGMFVTFFPHLIAGPIVRWNDLGHQIADKTRYRIDWGNVGIGLTIFTFGLAKKLLVADRLALHVSPPFDAAAAGAPVTFAAAWIAALAYSMQLYFDFSGYSDMAVGLGLLFNLRLPVNFAAPFRARSMIDLWRRWHMSLSRFLRDFVYVPLGGNRLGAGRQGLNLFITMVLGGIWHGAGWTFIVWGALMGACLAVNHWWRLWRGPTRPNRAKAVLGWAATLAAFAIGMVFFRSDNLSAAFRLLTSMAGLGNAPVAPMRALPWDNWTVDNGYFPDALIRWTFGTTWSLVGTLWTLGAVTIAVAVPDTMEVTAYAEGGNKRFQWRLPPFLTWQPSLPWLFLTFTLFLLTLAKTYQVGAFLYYQF